MSSHDYVIANDTGANVRADLNLALLAIQSQNSGSSEPSTTYAYQFWADTSGTPTLKQRNAANNAWINILTLSTGAPSATELSGDSSPQLGGDLDCNGAQIQWSKGADVASATALVLLTDGNYFDVTGTTTITSMNTTGGAGTLIKLHFDGALTLTHHATDLILPGGANITTAAGDEAEFIEYASGDYRCTNYTKASGAPVKIIDNSVDLAQIASGTDGELITWDASGDPAKVAVGTATHVLTSNGAGAAPTFQAAAGGGKVLQCIQEHVIAQSSQTVTAGGYQNITNLNKAITPTESDSNILVDIRYTGELDHASPADLIFGINRDATAIGNPSASGSHPIGIASWLIVGNTPGTTQFSTSYRYLDTGRSAGTSEITYYASCQFQYEVTLYNNRTKNNTDDQWNEFMTSTIILWEISA